MRKIKSGITHIIIAILVLAVSVDSITLPRDKGIHSGQNLYYQATGSLSDTIIDPIIDWPVSVGVQQTGEIEASFDCYGQIGLWGMVQGWPASSFVTPAGSKNEYVSIGSIWIGGIFDGDTAVSTGAEPDWYPSNEFYPFNGPDFPSIYRFKFVTDYSMRAEFCDTSETGYGISLHGHNPLDIKVVNRSHIWRTHPENMAVIYDMIITNIGNRYIDSAYIGLYLDGDVYHNQDYTSNGYFDDLAGSIKSKGIAYIIDNDGDPVSGQFVDSSVTRAIAVKYLKTSFLPTDTNFSWWVGRVYDPPYNFGPRLRPADDDPWRDFGECIDSPLECIGTPQGDSNKYYMMSHDEWDYDQFMTATITESNPIWMPPPPQKIYIANGDDARMMMSIGSFDLPPDSSVRILFATFTADSIHADPYNYAHNFDIYFPEPYQIGLGLEHLEDIAGISDSLAEFLLDPALPVIGLHFIKKNTDSVTVEWDQYVFEGIDGYQIYLTEINTADFPYPGVIPPWFRPDSAIPFDIIDSSARYTFYSLDDSKAYYINVAYRTGEETGDPGYPVYVEPFNTLPPPVPQSEYSFAPEGQGALIEWTYPDAPDLNHFNIYKFSSADSAQNKYHAFYDEGQKKDDISPADSFNIEGSLYYYYAIAPYAQRNSDITSFTDENAADGNVYFITAVDDRGFESDFSESITFNAMPDRNRDILVMISNTSKVSDFVTYDTIRAFFDSILYGYDYEIYDVRDSISLPNCSLSAGISCIDWQVLAPYKIIILEDGLFDAGPMNLYEERERGLTRYLLSGGILCYFGMPLSFLGITVLYDFGPEYYELDHPFTDRFFAVDSVMAYGLDYYFKHGALPYVDTVFGFNRADGITDDIPDLVYDDTRFPFYTGLTNFWPTNTAPLVASFKTESPDNVIQRFKSLYPDISIQESEPVGVLSEQIKSKMYIFGYHLWYMNHEDARALIDYIYSGIQTDIADNDNSTLPQQFRLHQNYPNPFNMATSISFAIPEKADVTLNIYNILGQKIRTLLNETLAAGVHSATWNSRDDNGCEVASGVYFYRIAAGEYLMSKKMLLLK